MGESLSHLQVVRSFFAYSLPSPFSAPAVRAIGGHDLRGQGERWLDSTMGGRGPRKGPPHLHRGTDVVD